MKTMRAIITDPEGVSGLAIREVEEPSPDIHREGEKR
jgi:hypothetical protein